MLDKEDFFVIVGKLWVQLDFSLNYVIIAKLKKPINTGFFSKYPVSS